MRAGAGLGKDSGAVVRDAGNGNTGNEGSHGEKAFHNSQISHDSRSSILPPRGDYQTLLSYQKSEVIYQITYRFCGLFFKKGDRTVDQMVQAARSGKQNKQPNPLRFLAVTNHTKDTT